MSRLLPLLINAFPLWVLGFSVAALLHPPLLTWFSGNLIVAGLAVIMLGMGLTLTVDDFRGITRTPKPVAFGVIAQFTVMPLLGWSIATLLHLDTPFAVGLILVACCPGGTVSNLVAFLARGDVALSVVMTTCSTLAAIIMTPLLTQWLAGTLVHVDGWGLFKQMLQVVLLPVGLGVALNRLLPRVVAKITPVAPLASALACALIVGSIVGQSSAAIRSSGGTLLLAVFLLHCGGFSLGYFLSRVFGYSPIIARTVSIEVGMQNSGLSVLLARGHFADPLTAVPGAISAVCHSVLGSLLAGFWRLTSSRPPPPVPPATPARRDVQETLQAGR